MSDVRVRLETMRTDLVQRARSLVDSFDGIVEAATDVATDDEHDPEGHTIAWERQQVGALIADAKSSIVDVDAALARLAAGTYGICTTCHRDVNPERLDALPATPVCVTCARGA